MLRSRRVDAPSGSPDAAGGVAQTPNRLYAESAATRRDCRSPLQRRATARPRLGRPCPHQRHPQPAHPGNSARQPPYRAHNLDSAGSGRGGLTHCLDSRKRRTRAGSEEAAAGYRAGVGDVLADAAEPAAVAFACPCGRDRFDEVAQVLVGIRGALPSPSSCSGAVPVISAATASIGRSSAGPWPAVPSSRRRSCAAHGGTTVWPSRPLTSAVTRGGSVQHVARSNRIWPGARSRKAATAPGSVLVRS